MLRYAQGDTLPGAAAQPPAFVNGLCENPVDCQYSLRERLNDVAKISLYAVGRRSIDELVVYRGNAANHCAWTAFELH
jgi:hypothetical protein